MTVVLPTNYGKADWTDYADYWREADAEWIQARLVLRYADAATRTTQLGATPAFGTLTYNESALGANLDRPEMYSKQHGKWVPLMMLDNITSTKDDAAGVALSHKQAGGKGVIFEPTRTQLDNPIHVMGGVLGVTATGVTIKTGTKTAKLTTDAANLISDSPISAPSLISGGALTAASATLSGSLTAGSVTAGTLASTGAITGVSATIGGVGLAANILTTPAGSGSANAAGVQSGQGYFYGDATSAVMRQRATAASAASANYLQVLSDRVNVGPATVAGGTGYFDVYPQMRVYGARGIHFLNTAGTHVAWISPSLYSASDPGAANFPDGTIWVS